MFSNDSTLFEFPSEDRAELRHGSVTVPASYTGRCPDYATNCGRILRWDEYLAIILGLSAYCFHISMLVFLMGQGLKSKSYFSSAFYRLYCVLGAAEILHATQVTVKIELC